MGASGLTIAIILCIALYFASRYERLKRIQPIAAELFARAIQKQKDPFKAAEQYMTYLEGTLPFSDYQFFMKYICKQYNYRFSKTKYGIPDTLRDHLVGDIGSQIRATNNHLKQLDSAS